MYRKSSLLIVASAVLATSALASAKDVSSSRLFEDRKGTRLTGDGISAAMPIPEATFTTDIDLAGWVANGDFTDPTNTSTVVTLLPNAFITGVEWINLNFTATGGSWRSDFTLSTNQSANTGAAGTFWDHSPSTQNSAGTYSGSGAFPNPSNRFSSGPFQLLADGQLLVYVWDDLDDNAGAPESTVASGTLRVTYSDSAPPPPPAPVSIPAVPGGSVSGTLSAGQVVWYSFTWGGGAITLDTEGTTLSGTNDTEIGLYDAATGALIASDDDTGTGNLSSLTGTLAAGNYLLAMGAFNVTFGAGFNATSTGIATGTYVINGISIPEPTSLAALALAGLVARRRR